MKKLLTVLVGLTVSINVMSQWQLLSHTIPSNAFWYIGFEFINNDTGFIADTEGRIFRTTNGGANWLEVAHNSTPIFADISFGDQSKGYVAGSNNIIMITNDGGATWTTEILDAGPSEGYTSVHAFDANLAFVSGTVNTWKTTDGGANWTHAANQNAGNSVYFASNMIGYGCGGNLITKSTDQGNSWTVVHTTTGNDYLWRVRFINTMEGIAVGDNGTILKTIDGGASWQSKPSGTTERLYDIEYITGTILYAAGQGNTVIKSVDGGETWHDDPVNVSNETFYKITTKPNGETYINSLGSIIHVDSCGSPTLSVNPFGLDSICFNEDPVNLPNVSPSYASWSGNGIVGNQFDPDGLATGTYVLVATTPGNSPGCELQDSVTIKVVTGSHCTNSIEDPSLGKLMIYPNPGTEQISIELEKFIGGKAILGLMTSSGQLVREYTLDTNPQFIDVSDLPTGIYTILLTTGQGVLTEKLVIQ